MEMGRQWRCRAAKSFKEFGFERRVEDWDRSRKVRSVRRVFFSFFF